MGYAYCLLASRAYSALSADTVLLPPLRYLPLLGGVPAVCPAAQPSLYRSSAFKTVSESSFLIC